MFISWKIQYFLFFIFASLELNFVSSSYEKVKESSQKDLNTFVMKFNEKLDYLSDQVDQMEAKQNNAFDAHEIITNITHAIISSNNEIMKQFEKKQNKMEELLFHLLNASERERSESDGEVGVWSEVNSLCHSTCQAKLATWVNSANATQLKTKLEKMDFQCDLTERKAVKVCDPNPCLYGGKCQPTSTGSDYVCIGCPKKTSGIHCENVNCTSLCWRVNDTMYVMTRPMITWTEAKVKCESEGMTLAMPKDEERTTFLYSRLNPIYSSQPYVWLGLKHESSGWYWLDVSGVGKYTGGRDDMKSVTGLYFGLLSFHGGSKMWTWDYATALRYPLCETQLISH